MDTLNHISYSKEAITLFAKKPPLLIRSGYILICLLIFILVASGSMLNVPYVYKVQIYRAENGCFQFENKGVILNKKPFKIVSQNGDRIEVNIYSSISIDNIAYIQFTLKESEKPFIEDSNIYDIITDISLIECYSTYLLHGT